MWLKLSVTPWELRRIPFPVALGGNTDLGEKMTKFLDPAQTVVDLREAARLLEQGHWIQGYDFDGHGCMCAFGAVRRAVGDDLASCSTQTRDRASNAGRAFYRVIGADIVTYNDAEGRTKNQMIRAMQTVASALEEDPRRA